MAGGAGSGLVVGLLFGLFFDVWFAHDGTSLLAILCYWAGFGALLGAGIALAGYALIGGRRHFTSVKGVEAQHFDILVDEPFADDAAHRLARVSPRLTGPPERSSSWRKRSESTWAQPTR